MIVDESKYSWAAWKQPKMTSNTTWGIVSATYSNNGHEPYLALDNNMNTQWENKDEIFPTDFIWEFEKPLKISAIKLTNKKSTNFAMQSQLNNSLLLTQILHQRKAAAFFISSFLKSKVDKIKVIKKSLIIHLIQMRKKSCVKIQSTFRMFLVFSHFKKIFSESKFIFFYDFNANLFHQFKNNNPYMQNQLKIKIFISKGEQYFKTFSYSK